MLENNSRNIFFFTPIQASRKINYNKGRKIPDIVEMKHSIARNLQVCDLT